MENFSPILLRIGFEYLTDMIEIMVEYKNITGKEYIKSFYDKELIKILRKYNKIGISHEIFYIKTILIPYTKIKQNIAFEYLNINYDKFKIDNIKKIISSEDDSERILNKINEILFQSTQKLKLTEKEYLNI